MPSHCWETAFSHPDPELALPGWLSLAGFPWEELPGWGLQSTSALPGWLVQPAGPKRHLRSAWCGLLQPGGCLSICRMALMVPSACSEMVRRDTLESS